MFNCFSAKNTSACCLKVCSTRLLCTYAILATCCVVFNVPSYMHILFCLLVILNIKFQSQVDLWLVVRKKNHHCWPRMLKCHLQVVLWLKSLMSWKKLHQDLVKLQHSTTLVSYFFLFIQVCSNLLYM